MDINILLAEILDKERILEEEKIFQDEINKIAHHASLDTEETMKKFTKMVYG